MDINFYIDGLVCLHINYKEGFKSLLKGRTIILKYFSIDRQSFYVKLLKCSYTNVYFILGHKRVLVNAQQPINQREEVSLCK